MYSGDISAQEWLNYLYDLWQAALTRDYMSPTETTRMDADQAFVDYRAYSDHVQGL